MIKHLILLSLIAFSLQIENCKDTRETYTGCFTGYQYVELNDDTATCVNKTNYDALQEKMPGCYQGDASTVSCTACQRDYVLTTDGKNCTKNEHCSSVDASNVCTNCINPFVLDGTKCIEKLLCLEMKSGKCTKCKSYYYPDNDGNCKRIKIEHCTELDGEKCKYCETNYYKDDDDKKCTPYPENCVNVDSSKKCSQCNSLYYIDDDGKKCTHYPDGCLTYDKSSDTCSSCLGGYYQKNNKCQKINIDHCIKSNDEGATCETCESLYYKENENHKCTKYPDNCVAVDGNHKCTQCSDKFYPSEDGKSCIKYPDNCLEVDDQHKCTSCDYFYYIDNDGKACTHYPDGCQTYQKSSDTCGSCLGGYYPKNNKCQKINIEHCIKSNDEGVTCDTCESGCIKSEDSRTCNKICQGSKKYCNTCESNYDSYDYGNSCKVLDPDLIPKDDPKDESRFINLNLLISALVLALII